jgi:hypothetical protein
MAVVSTGIVQVKPDRWEEFVEQIRKAKGILEGHGAKNFRLLVGLVAGQQTGAVVVTEEFDDFAAYGPLWARSWPIRRSGRLCPQGPTARCPASSPQHSWTFRSEPDSSTTGRWGV